MKEPFCAGDAVRANRADVPRRPARAEPRETGAPGGGDALPAGGGKGSGMPGTVVALGVVSLLMDTSSELIHSLLPLLLVGTFGVGATVFGLIEGAAEAAVMVTKVVAGAWSDRLGRRKPLLLAGYGLATAVKPLFPLAAGAGTVFVARLLDRIGKGVRGAPRDALVSDVTPSERRGAAFGLRQALDSVGAVLGPLAAFVLVGALGGIRPALWWAIAPALLSCLVLALWVREPRREPRTAAPVVDWRAARALGRPFWVVTGIGAVFTLARFSEGFVLLRAADLGVDTASVPLVLAGMSAVYALSAYPAGKLSDRLARASVLALGALVLAVADIALALAGGLVSLAGGTALWGLHLGLTQGVLSALVADASPPHLRGTAFGVFALASGLALLAASVLAGALWQLVSPPATFWAGAALAGSTAALVLLGDLLPRGRRHEEAGAGHGSGARG